MAKVEVVENRLFKNVWICMKCNAKNRSSEGRKPEKCRKCNSKRFRPKRKVRKAVKS